jgi:hypothetical protein
MNKEGMKDQFDGFIINDKNKMKLISQYTKSLEKRINEQTKKNRFYR